MLCDNTFSGEMQHACLFPPYREPTTDQSMNATKVVFSERWVLSGLIKEPEMTQIQGHFWPPQVPDTHTMLVHTCRQQSLAFHVAPPLHCCQLNDSLGIGKTSRTACRHEDKPLSTQCPLQATRCCWTVTYVISARLCPTHVEHFWPNCPFLSLFIPVLSGSPSTFFGLF